MDGPGLTGDEEFADHIELGRPRPEPRELMTAKQLVYAYADAPSDEDREYAAAEAESFLYSLGDHAATEVLLTLLQLPDGDGTSPVTELVMERLTERAPGVVPALLRSSLEGEGAARVKSASILDNLPTRVLALGLIQTLAGHADDWLKESAAETLVALGRPAVSEILDALADPDVRPWIVWASGAGGSATDAEVLRRIAAASADRPG